MGSLLGRNRTVQDPFYSNVPLGTGDYVTSDPYGSMQSFYGTGNYGGPNPQGESPLNYGNYYMGNTKVRVIFTPTSPSPCAIPSMCNFGNAGFSSWPSMYNFGNTGFSSWPSMMPYSMPSSYSMPMAAPMMAAAAPLPVAYSPLVQGMYPMPSMSPASWMTPSSFMSALSSGPMPYRPPGYDFPSNIGMVMPIPYGTPNPWFSPPSYDGFGSSPVSYYPRPVSVPQPYPVPYPVPMPIPSVQQVPVPRHVTVVAPPIMGDASYGSSMPFGAPLLPSQGAFTNSALGQPLVMTSNNNSTTVASLYNQPTISSLPTHNQNDLPSIDYASAGYQTNTDHYIPPIVHGQLISDSGWLPKSSKFQAVASILSGRKRKRPFHASENGRSTLPSTGSRISFIPRRRRRDSGSSTSEYDCPICQQQREKRRLRRYYGSSTVSSLLSSSKGSHSHHLTTNESVLSPGPHISSSFKQNTPRSHRRHPTRIKVNNKTSSIKSSSSPVLLRKAPIQEQRIYDTIHEVEEKKENQAPRKVPINIPSAIAKSDQSDSEISIKSND